MSQFLRFDFIYILSLTFRIRYINRKDHSMNADWSKGLTESCRNISSVHSGCTETPMEDSAHFLKKITLGVKFTTCYKILPRTCKIKEDFLSRLVQLIYILPKWLYLDMPGKV